MSFLEKYPAPDDGAIFGKYWEKYLVGIVSRDNFKLEHLDQLAVLCSLFKEHDEIVEFFKDEPRTYLAHGRNGTQIKVHPLVTQLNRTRAEIRAYTRALGVVLVKDTLKKPNEGEESDWGDGDED